MSEKGFLSIASSMWYEIFRLPWLSEHATHLSPVLRQGPYFLTNGNVSTNELSTFNFDELHMLIREPDF